MHGCLHGIRIVDMTANVSGPFGTAMLGDMGADVIKVEAPGNGDISRRYGMIIETEHPDAGPMRTPRPPIIFGETPSSIRRHAPQAGAHTDEVLAEVGYSADQIAAMREKGVLG